MAQINPPPPEVNFGLRFVDKLIASISSARHVNVMEIIGNAIVGGMESYVSRLVAHLPADKFTVTCVCPFESRFTDNLRLLGGDVVVTAIQDDPTWAAIQTITALTRAKAIDVIHAHLPNAHVLAALVGKLSDTPVLATVHGRAISSMDLEIHRAAGTHLSVVCRAAYLNAFGNGVRPDRLHLVPNGIDGAVFRPGGRSNSLQKMLALPGDTPLVAFVGRLSPEKGPEVFLRMAWLVREACPFAHFVLIGDGPLKEKLTAMVAQMDLKNTVHFAGEQNDMSKIYPSLELVVSSSHSEGMPFALMEAMASGLPVVATHVGGSADIVEVGVTGFLARAGDYETLAKSVVTLLSQSELRQSMSAAARARAERQFPWSESIAAMTNLLVSLASSDKWGRRVGSVPSVNGQVKKSMTNGIGEADGLV